MKFDFTGKTALVTGTAVGVGRAPIDVAASKYGLKISAFSYFLRSKSHLGFKYPPEMRSGAEPY